MNCWKAKTNNILLLTFAVALVLVSPVILGHCLRGSSLANVDDKTANDVDTHREAQLSAAFFSFLSIAQAFFGRVVALILSLPAVLLEFLLSLFFFVWNFIAGLFLSVSVSFTTTTTATTTTTTVTTGLPMSSTISADLTSASASSTGSLSSTGATTGTSTMSATATSPTSESSTSTVTASDASTTTRVDPSSSSTTPATTTSVTSALSATSETLATSSSTTPPVTTSSATAAMTVTSSTSPLPSTSTASTSTSASAPSTSTSTSAIVSTTTANLGVNKTVFVTSQQFQGDFGGLEGADAKCSELALLANLTGRFMSWISNSSDNPLTRFTKSTAPYVMLDGRIFADNFISLVSSGPNVILNVQEDSGIINLATPVINRLVWTNTKNDGTSNTLDCLGWTDTPGRNAFVGAVSVESEWTMLSDANCAFNLRLYCFQQ